jgi:hypothetical protein
VLTVLSDLAEDAPVLCLVDDLHWIDVASRDALLFAVRRLSAEGVAALFAARGDTVPTPGLPQWHVESLASGDALAILQAQATLPPDLRDEIVAAAAGNPLALIELAAAAREASPEAVNAGSPVRPPAAAGRVEQGFARQISDLPQRSRLVLTIIAADGTGGLEVVLEAAGRLGAGPADIEAAERAQLIHVDGSTVRFRHPLIRSSAYHSATLPERIAAHRVLAEVLVNQPDAGRRAWHLAAAAFGPDKTAAAALEQSADSALRAGGRAAAAAAYERAARLVSSQQRQAALLAKAAIALSEIDRMDRALELAGEAGRLTGEPLVHSRLALIRADRLFEQDRLTEGAETALSAAESIADQDPGTAALTYFRTAANLWNACLPDEVTRVAKRLAGTGISAKRLCPRAAPLGTRALGACPAQVRGDDRRPEQAHVDRLVCRTRLG